MELGYRDEGIWTVRLGYMHFGLEHSRFYLCIWSRNEVYPRNFILQTPMLPGQCSAMK